MRDLTDIDGLDLTDEVFEVLHTAGGSTLERIVSNGQTTQWLVQDHDEWVMVIAGAARLEGDDATVELTAGQALLIPAQVRHRVVWTEQPTVWIAVHFPGAA